MNLVKIDKSNFPKGKSEELFKNFKNLYRCENYDVLESLNLDDSVEVFEFYDSLELIGYTITKSYKNITFFSYFFIPNGEHVARYTVDMKKALKERFKDQILLTSSSKDNNVGEGRVESIYCARAGLYPTGYALEYCNLKFYIFSEIENFDIELFVEMLEDLNLGVLNYQITKENIPESKFFII